MKKQLLSTSALVAAGLVAASGVAEAQTAPGSSPIQLSLGGFMRQQVGIQDTSNILGIGNPTSVTGKVASIFQTSDTEIYFTGKTTLSNGIAVAVRVELEGNTSNDMIDEAWTTIDGTFGTLHLGSTDNAASKMVYGAPAAWTGAGFPNASGGPASGGSAGMPPTGTGTGLSGTLALGADDSNLISYFTPRIEGIQLGYSYVPQLQQDNGVAVNAGSSYNRGHAFGLNFVRKIGDVDVALSGGYFSWNKPESVVGFDTTTLKDPKAWTLGGQLGYAGFKVGAGYGKVKDFFLVSANAAGANTALGSATARTSGDGDAYEFGVTYTFGATSVGVVHNRGKYESTTYTPGSDSQETYRLEGSYVLGPGVSFSAAAYHTKLEGELNPIGTPFGDRDNNKVTGLITSIALSF